MVPHNIIIKNYKSYGDEETKIDLSDNSVKLVYGNIGAGKTTFVDGIIWCLYGESLVNIDEVINRKNKKNCKVEFNFSIGENYFSIIRYRKHETYGDEIVVFKNHKNISPVRKRDAQELINSIVGMNHKAMISSVMFSSEIYISFLRVREAKRLEIFDSVLNMNIFKKWYDVTRKFKAPIEEEYAIACQQIEKLLYGKETINHSIEEYKSNCKRQLIQLKEDKSKLEKIKQDFEREIEEYKNIDVTKEIEISQKYEEVEKHNAFIKDEIHFADKAMSMCDYHIQTFSKEYNELKEEVERLSKVDVGEEKRKIKISRENEKREQEIKYLESKIISLHDLEREIKRKEKRVEELESKIANLETSICYTCGQSIDEEKVDKLKRKLIVEKNELLIAIEEEKSKLESQEESNRDIFRQIEISQNKIEDVVVIFSEEELDNIAENINLHKMSMKFKEDEIENEIKEKDKQEEKLKKYKERLLDEVEAPKYNLYFLQDIQKEIQEKEEKIRQTVSDIQSINKQASSLYSKKYVEDLEKKIVAINEKIQEVEKVKTEKNERLRYYNYLLKILSNKDYGIKKYIISKMIDIFNKNINKYIPLFFDRDIIVEFDKNLKETIYENKQEISFNSFSSGEKSLLDISIAFSLYMLVKDFFSSDIRFLVFDEILDRNLDEEGIQAILQVIQELAKDNSIMVISHRQELQESFEKRIHVYKEDGFSKIETTL